MKANVKTHRQLTQKQCEILSSSARKIRVGIDFTEDQLVRLIRNQMLVDQHQQYYKLHIKRIENPTEKILIAALEEYYVHFSDIPNPTEQIITTAIRLGQLDNVEKFRKKLSHIQQRLLVEQDGQLLRFFEPAPESIRLAAVKQNGYAILAINQEDRSVKLQLAAVKRSPDVISYLDNPSRKVIFTALKADPLVIAQLHAADVDDKMIKFAVEHFPELIELFPNATFSIQASAIRADPQVIRLISNPHPEIQLIAVRKNPELIFKIKNATVQAKQLAIDLDSSLLSRAISM